ncbi:RIB43A-like with coiled-coils protein 2 [Cylas formicarius]|uniref:RIB43A-like with coiled-coils protein 2 n=1 Tax=Cylas formicarius TaxID=197179 RepID=UPI0029587661|nr:RIB43A-like with coiled-coils protein 2 [Cylas formicarius]
MLSFQLMTEKDRKEAAYIERKRIQEEERRKRIFNPRLRVIGIDTEALQRQVEEKRNEEENRRKLDKLFDDRLNQADQLALQYSQKQKNEERKLQQEINNFRKYCQRPEDRREFDLNDPEWIKKQLPARLDDDDPRLGPSSAQKFEGEDLISEQRLKLQREQNKAWLDQQLLEKNQAERDRQLAEDAYREAVSTRDRRASDLEKLEKDCRRKLEEACKRYNKALADERLNEKMNKERQILEDNTAEIYNNLTSDLLTENPDVSQSNIGLGRKIAYSYKGMSEEEKQQIRKEQLCQIEESKKRKELESKMNSDFDNYINGINRSVHLMNKELDRKRREKNKQLAEENRRLAEEQKNHKQYLEKIVYANRTAPEYFQQFNKSSR